MTHSLITASEAAEQLGVSLEEILVLVAEGTLRSLTIETSVYVHQDDVIAYKRQTHRRAGEGAEQ